MKLLHLAIIVILTSGLVVYNGVFADNQTIAYGGLVRSHQTMASESMIQLLTGKHTYVPGEKIQIIGAFNPHDLIHVDLVNPADGAKNSTLLQSDNISHFRTNYIVPYDAVNGTWKILATSGVNHASLDIQVISSNSGINGNTTHNYGPNSLAVVKIPSPLQQFKSGIAAEDVKCSTDYALVIKSEDSSPACVKPETAKRFYEQGWASVLTVNIENNNANQTLVIGTDTYDVRGFQPISGNAVYFDDLRFVYKGRSPLNDSCYPEIVNQTQARDFEIVSNEADFNSHSCWPPSNYPQNITKQNVLPSDLFSRYSISFFNNQTMGIGLCYVDSCEFGKMIYLAKRGWDTPIVYDSVSNLEFHIFTNSSIISTGQSIGINMSTINKAQNTIIVPNKYDFSFNGTGLGPCYYGPFELEILRGYFDESNFTHGAELHLYQPGIYSCPVPEGAKGYKFEPSSDASTPRCSPFNYCNSAEQMRYRVSFSGYWNDTSFHKFESGMYTIITGDEWGNHSIRYFTITR